MLDEGVGSTRPNGKTYVDVVVERGFTSISVEVDERRILKTSDRKYRTGFLAVSPSFYAVRIKGRVEKRYFRTVEGEFHAKRFAEWKRTSYRRPEHVPAWLRTAPVAVADPAAGTPALLPSDAPEDETAVILRSAVRAGLRGEPSPSRTSSATSFRRSPARSSTECGPLSTGATACAWS